MAKIARAFACTQMAPGNATLMGSQERLTPAGAVWANSIAASALDLDDGHRLAMGHPGAAVIPAAIATAEDIRATGADLLAAVVAGYEIAVRTSVARRAMYKERQYATGIWAVYGAAAAAGKLLKLDHAQFQSALGIAQGHGPFPPSGAFTNDNMVKEGIGWSAMTGCAAAYLAWAGFHGPADALDQSQRFHQELLAKEIPAGPSFPYAIAGAYFKPHAACRWAHPAIDAALELAAREKFTPDDVTSIDVACFYEATRLSNPCPETPIGAQFSIPFNVATALIHRQVTPEELSENHLTDPLTRSLAHKVHLHIDPALDELFPRQTAVHLTIRTRQGVFEQTVAYPKGNPENPMSDDELRRKATHLTRDFLKPDQIDRLWDAVWRLEQVADLSDLCNLLAG